MSSNKKRDITSFFTPKNKRTRGEKKQEEQEETKEEETKEEERKEEEEGKEEQNTTTNTTNTTNTTTESNEDNHLKSSSSSPSPTTSTTLAPSTPCPYDVGTWSPVLQDEFSKSYFRNLMRFVDQEYSSSTVYPPRDQIFSAFTTCDFNKLKVVIIGQDPYHGPNQAHGLSFSVLEGNAPPPSLRNIFKEAQVSLYFYF